MFVAVARQQSIRLEMTFLVFPSFRILRILLLLLLKVSFVFRECAWDVRSSETGENKEPRALSNTLLLHHLLHARSRGTC